MKVQIVLIRILHPRLSTFAWWELGRKVPPVLFLPLEEIYKDMTGRELTVLGNNGKAFMVMQELDNGTVVASGGADFHILTMLADKFNFT